MRKVFAPVAAFCVVTAMGASFAFADVLTAPDCVKGKWQGDASTYNPFKPGWRSGGPNLATGGRYDPNQWAAALQLQIAQQTGCGYGSGRVCNAVVQAPNGKTAILLINDNGPLVPGRVIDLNERAMDYFSDGNVSAGVVKNVTVTVLCMADGQFLGPVGEADRQAWQNRTFDIPTNSPPGGYYGPGPGGMPYYGQGTGFPTNIGFPTGGTGMPIGGTPYQPSQSYPPGDTPYNPYSPSGSSPGTPYSPNTSDPVQGGTSASNIIVWPKTVSRGGAISVSWTSVNMAKNSCKVMFDGQEFAKANEGSKPFKTVTSDASTLSFTLRCQDSSGQYKEMSDSATIQ